MSYDACIAAVEKAVGRDLTGTEKEEIFKRADRFVKKWDKSGRPKEQLEQALAEFSQTVLTNLAIQRRNALINSMARMRMYRYVTDIWGDRPDRGLEALLMGVESGVSGSRDSVASLVTMMQQSSVSGMGADLEAQKLTELFRTSTSNDMDADVFAAMKALNSADDEALKGINPTAVKIARILDKHYEDLRGQANRVGANIGKLDGFVTSRTHDSYKLNNDKEGWIAFMRKNLDLEKSFDGSFVPDARGNLSPEDEKSLMEALNSVHTSLVSGEHLVMGGEKAPSAFQGFANLAKSMSQSRVFHFKTPDADAAYLKDFGSGDLATSVMYDMTNRARDIALMQRLGTNPADNVMRVVASIMKNRRDDTDVMKRLNAFKDTFKNSWWPTLSGEINTVAAGDGAMRLATLDHIYRSLTRLAKLPNLLFAQVGDMANVVDRAALSGRGTMAGIHDSMRGLASFFALSDTPADVKKQLSDFIGSGTDGLSYAVSGRFDDFAHDTPGNLSRLEGWMYKWTGATRWTDKMRASAVQADMNYMGANAKRFGWGDIDPAYQRDLAKSGIGEKEWAAIRTAVRNGQDGREYIGLDTLAEAQDDVIAPLVEAAGLKPTKRNIEDYRRDLQMKVRAYFHQSGELAVLTPNLKTRAITAGRLKGGVHKQGTGYRVAHNLFFALKTFPIAVMQRVLGAHTLGRSMDPNATVMSSIAANPASFIGGISRLVVASTMMGYISMTLKDTFKNRTPREPSWEVVMASAAQGGGLGIYGDFLFGDALENRYGQSLLGTMGGPFIGDAEAVYKMASRFKAVLFDDGDGGKLGKEVTRFFASHLPFVGSGTGRAVFDAFVWNDLIDMMDPGYKARVERNLRNSTGQEKLFSLD